MLHAVLVRSPVAHARIRAVDLSRAAAMPGVAAALNGADLLRLLPPVPEGQISLPSKWATVIQHKFLNPQQPLLAHDKVRHVGEAIAIIVAESRDQAEDAAELVTLDLEELPAVVDPEAALRAESPIVHDRFDTNLIGAFSVGRGDAEAALARAPHRLERRFYHHRYAAVPMECRGVVAAYDPRTDSDDDLVVDPGGALGAPRSRGAARACPRRGCAASRSMSAAALAARAMSTPRTC